MPHVIEPASSGRARCRGCAKPIAKGVLRFGERLANPYGDGEMTLWFHLACASFKRPEALLEGLEQSEVEVQGQADLKAAAAPRLEHRRMPRVDGAERASSGRAKCRHCREPIPKHSWRIKLVYYSEGRFDPGGFVHAACAPLYFESAEILDAVRCFSPELSDEEASELTCELRSAPQAGGQPVEDVGLGDD